MAQAVKRTSTRRDNIHLSATVGETPTLAALYHAWWSVMHDADPASDGESNVLVDIGNDLEKRILALPTNSAQDLAMKLVVASGGVCNELPPDFYEREITPLISKIQKH